MVGDGQASSGSDPAVRWAASSGRNNTTSLLDTRPGDPTLAATDTEGPSSTPATTRLALVDTHAHLAWPDFVEDLNAVLERARAAGLERLLAVGVDQASSAASVDLARRNPGVYAAVGLHPNSCGDHEHAFKAVEDLARQNGATAGGPVRAIGETGLDFYRDRVPAPVQEESFRRHLILSAELDLPVVIHNRQADDAVLRALRAAPRGVRGVLHCFSADQALADAALELGLYLSFAGNLTYRSAQGLRCIAAGLPADRLLTETDAPFLPPHPWRGKRNEPAYVAQTLRVLAEARQCDVAELARQVAANARALFGW